MAANLPIASLSPLPPLGDLSARWQSLEKRSTGSFFTSWAWMGTLLKLTQATPLLFALRRHKGGELEDIALAILGNATRKSVFGTIPFLTLNQTGIPAEDAIYPEFNQILCPRDLRQEAAVALFDFLPGTMPDHMWQALRLSGMEAACLKTLVEASDFKAGPQKTSPAPFINLNRVREDGNFLDLISANKRSQIRRSIRLFEDLFGPVAITRLSSPTDIEEALDILVCLQIGKMATQPGVSTFGSPFMLQFLSTLLTDFPAAKRQAHNPSISTGKEPPSGAELLLITAGEQRLGYLVNFHFHNVVSNYQCAFTRFSDNRLKPGLVAHAAVIKQYAAQGFDVYHLLAGDQQYKASLATDSNTLIWTELQRPRSKLRLETAAKYISSNMKARLTR